MSRIGETANRPQADVFQGQLDASRAHQEVLRGLDGKQVCPFCGSVGEKSDAPCARCGMDNTPDARKATKARIGPWYVLQARNPAAPGMRFETLLSFVRKGRVRARSVVRGPTTHQLWRFAAHVKGLSREFGLCFSCGSAVDPAANICPQCNRLQEPPLNPDILLEDGSEADATGPRPVYRELPNPADVAPIAPVPPPPVDVDIVIPAFSAFDSGDLEAKPNETPAAPSQPPTPAARPASPFASSSPRPGPVAASPSSRPPLSENPFAIAPARKKGNGDSTFLSAKDLAAAFKLSFDPSADMETVDVPDQMPASAMPDGMRPSALAPRPPMQLAPSAGPSFEPVPKQRGAFKKFVLFVLIVAVTGFAVLMWVDPQSRQKTAEWIKTNYAKLSQFANGTDVQPKSTPADVAPAPDESKASTPTPAAADDEAKPTLDGVTDDARVVEKETEPLDPAPPAPAVKAETEPAKVESKPAPPAPAAKAPEVAAAPTSESVADTSPMEKVTSENVMAVKNRGVKAEGAGDYAGALRVYQSIEKQLPRSEWPSDLGVRMTRMKNAIEAQKKKAAK